MIYAIFETFEEAKTYADNATAALPRGPNDETEVWDTPRECVDGRWAVVSTDGQGETDVAFPEVAPTEEAGDG
jgi:hypothetical protein